MNRKMSATAAIVATASLTLAACSGGSSGGGGPRGLATGGSGGVFYVLGAGMASMVSNGDANYELQAQGTAATGENLRLIQSGDVDFAFAVYDAAVDAYNGDGEYTEAYDNVRLVMPGHNGYYHVLAGSTSGVSSLEELDGKRVGISPGYIGENLASGMVEPFGMSAENMQTTALSFTEMADGLKNNTLDVATITAGLPASSVVELQTSVDLEFLSQTKESQAQIIAEHPYWIPATIPKDVYGTDEDVLTFAAPYVIVANAEVPDEVVQEFMQAIYADPEGLTAIHAEGANYTTEHPLFDTELLIPLHDGAQTYLSAEGVVDE